MARLGKYPDPNVQRLSTECEREFGRQDQRREAIEGYISDQLIPYLESLAAFVGFTDPPAPPW